MSSQQEKKPTFVYVVQQSVIGQYVESNHFELGTCVKKKVAVLLKAEEGGVCKLHNPPKNDSKAKT